MAQQFVVKYRTQTGTKIEGDTQTFDDLSEAVTLVNNVIENSDKVLSLTLKTKRAASEEAAAE
jgi:hypothetical protein